MFLVACSMSVLDFSVFCSMCDFSNTPDKIYQMHTNTHTKPTHIHLHKKCKSTIVCVQSKDNCRFMNKIILLMTRTFEFY